LTNGAQPQAATATQPIHIDPLFTTVTVVETNVTGSSGRTSKTGSATAFFFKHGEQKYLITNRHVVANDNLKIFPDVLVLRVHIDPRVLTANREITVPLYVRGSPIWMEHPTLPSDIDLVAIEIGSHLQSQDLVTFWDASLFLPRNIIIGIAADAHVIGYPFGFYDVANNLPVVRNGTLATPYGVPFDGKPIFLVDANLHPGTSGSPVVSPSSDIRRMTDGSTALGRFPPNLLGINSGEYFRGGIGLGLNFAWYPELLVEIITRTSNLVRSPQAGP
jgi:S1-C subfamily serine protease